MPRSIFEGDAGEAADFPPGTALSMLPRYNRAGEANRWEGARTETTGIVALLGTRSLWSERGTPGLDGYQITMLGEGLVMWVDVFRLTRTSSGGTLQRWGIRTCQPPGSPPADPGASEDEIPRVAVTFPGRPILAADMDRLDACVGDRLWSLPTVDTEDPILLDADGALLERLQAGRYHAIELEPFSGGNPHGKPRSVIRQCLHDVGIVVR